MCHSVLKGEIPMDSISKMYIDLDKPNFYYCSIKGKLAKNNIFYISRLFQLDFKVIIIII